LHQTGNGGIDIAIPVGSLGKMVLFGAKILIAFRGRVNVKIVKRVPFDSVCMLVAFAVVPSQPEDLIRVRGNHAKDYREIQLIEIALSKHENKLIFSGPRDLELPLLMSAFLHEKKAGLVIRGKQLPLGQ
jgi:hypothetical protein